MPYYSELGLYTGPSSTYTGAYVPGPYSNHSSILASNFSRPSSSILKSIPVRNFRGFKPHLATISESNAQLRRINSPKLGLHSLVVPKLSQRPVKINTADIDVSVNKYRRYNNRQKELEAKTPLEVRKSKSPSPNSEIGMSPSNNSSSGEEKEATPNKIIRRDRATIRIQTIHKDSDQNSKSWRDNFLPDELNTLEGEGKRPKKTQGELLKEKHLIRHKNDEIATTKRLSRRNSKKSTSGTNGIQKTPSFHDICTAITKDKIEEELNPGQPLEIQRRQSRQYSSEDLFSFRRNSSEEIIVDEKLDRGSVKTKKKKLTKKKSNEKVVLPSDSGGSLAGEQINKSGIQRRPTQKKIRRSSLTAESEPIIVDAETQKAYQEAIRDISQVEIERIKIKPRPIITSSVDYNVQEKSSPSLIAVVDDVEVEESPNKPKKTNKFKFNVIVEEVLEPKKKAPLENRVKKQEGVLHSPKPKGQVVSDILTKSGKGQLGNILEETREIPKKVNKSDDLARKIEEKRAAINAQKEEISKLEETKKNVGIKQIVPEKKTEVKVEPISKNNTENDISENVNRSEIVKTQKEEISKFKETKNNIGIKEIVSEKKADVKIEPISKSKTENNISKDLNKPETITNAQKEEITKLEETKKNIGKQIVFEKKIEVKVDPISKSKTENDISKNTNRPETINAQKEEISKLDETKNNIGKQILPEKKAEVKVEPISKIENDISENVNRPETIKKSENSENNKPTLIKKDHSKTNLHLGKHMKKISEDEETAYSDGSKKESDQNYWDEIGTRSSIVFEPKKVTPLTPEPAQEPEPKLEEIVPRALPSKRSIVNKANKEDPDLEVFEPPPDPEPEPPEPESDAFVPLQSNRLSQFMHPFKKPEQYEECPVEIFARPKTIRKRHYPRPRHQALPVAQPPPPPPPETSSSEEDDSEEEDTTSEESSSGEEENVGYSNKVGASTSSNDSGFDSAGVPGSRNKACDVNCHKKCEKLTANLCGVNQKLIVEAIEAVRKGSSESRESPTANPAHNPAFALDSADGAPEEYSQSSTFAGFQKSGRITPPATTIPRFRKYCVEDFNFLKVLGKGSFGKVLLAELKNTEYYYAIKCLKKDVVLEDDDVECTLIERKVLALGTKHPYLCHLLCTFQTESHLFFVMEYLNGGDLMFHIQQSGRFTEYRAKFYGAEIVSGLKFLHNKGIVYRDLKLDNILLDFDGHVRIADFGMCKLQIFLDRTADTFCGTPDYMAPEILKGLHYNQCVDWWSFGVLLYEMLIGQSPFSGCDEDELFWSICNEKPVIPRFLSSQASAVLLLFLEKDASKRLGNRFCPSGDIPDQPFFHQIDWGKLEARQLEAPFKPNLLHPLDTQYFDRTFTVEKAKLTPIEQNILQSMDQTQFQGFSYTNPNATDK